MDNKLRALAVLGGISLLFTAGLVIPAVSARIPPWVQVVAPLTVLIVSGLLGTYASEEVKKLTKNFQAWRENTPFVYAISARIYVPAHVAHTEIFEKITLALRSENLSYKDSFRNSNNMVVELDNPPISIRVRISPDVVDEDDFEEVEARNIIEILPVSTEIIRYHDRLGQRIGKVINTFYDLARDVSKSFSTDQPEIFLTINRLKNIESAKSVVTPKGVISRKLENGLQVVKAENALQISAKTRNGIIDQLKQDLTYLEPVA